MATRRWPSGGRRPDRRGGCRDAAAAVPARTHPGPVRAPVHAPGDRRRVHAPRRHRGERRRASRRQGGDRPRHPHGQRLDLGFFERTPAGVVISRLTNDVEAMNSMVTDGPTTLLQNTLTLIGSAVVLLLLDWRLALATLSVFPAMAIGTAIFRRYSARAYRRTRERMGDVTASLQEDISGVRVVQAFRREDANYRSFIAVNDRYRYANVQTVN